MSVFWFACTANPWHFWIAVLYCPTGPHSTFISDLGWHFYEELGSSDTANPRYFWQLPLLIFPWTDYAIQCHGHSLKLVFTKNPFVSSAQLWNFLSQLLPYLFQHHSQSLSLPHPVSSNFHDDLQSINHAGFWELLTNFTLHSLPLVPSSVWLSHDSFIPHKLFVLTFRDLHGLVPIPTHFLSSLFSCHVPAYDLWSWPPFIVQRSLVLLRDIPSFSLAAWNCPSPPSIHNTTSLLFQIPFQYTPFVRWLWHSGIDLIMAANWFGHIFFFFYLCLYSTSLTLVVSFAESYKLFGIRTCLMLCPL